MLPFDHTPRGKTLTSRARLKTSPRLFHFAVCARTSACQTPLSTPGPLQFIGKSLLGSQSKTGLRRISPDKLCRRNPQLINGSARPMRTDHDFAMAHSLLAQPPSGPRGRNQPRGDNDCEGLGLLTKFALKGIKSNEDRSSTCESSMVAMPSDWLTDFAKPSWANVRPIDIRSLGFACVKQLEYPVPTLSVG